MLEELFEDVPSNEDLAKILRDLQDDDSALEVFCGYFKSRYKPRFTLSEPSQTTLSHFVLTSRHVKQGVN